jgi:hypothetical protein
LVGQGWAGFFEKKRTLYSIHFLVTKKDRKKDEDKNAEENSDPKLPKHD